MKKGAVSMLSVLTGAAAGAGVIGRMEREKRKKAEKLSGKFASMFHLMNQWVKVKQDGKNLSSYFEKNHYTKIAVYGMGYVGETLLGELKDTGIEVSYGIDKRVFSGRSDLPIVSPDDSLEHVDVVVVTAIDFFDEIEEKLRDKVKCPVISIEDVVFEVS